MFVRAFKAGVLTDIGCVCAIVGTFLVQVRCSNIDVFDADPVCCCYVKEEAHDCFVGHIRGCFSWIKVYVEDHFVTSCGASGFLLSYLSIAVAFVPAFYGEGDEQSVGRQLVAGDPCNGVYVIKKV